MGIDVCVNACKVIEGRLRSHFDTLWDDIEFIGMPKTPDDAKTLASLDKFRFERWAASLVDGMRTSANEGTAGSTVGAGFRFARANSDMVSQVKGGSTGPGRRSTERGSRQAQTLAYSPALKIG